MNLTKLYIREIYLKQFCEEIENNLQLSEDNSNADLQSLLEKANDIIFPRFGISPSDRYKYFIAGSARLHLYPELSSILNDKIGDLDIVVPGEEEWKHLENYLIDNDIPYNKEDLKKGIYRPEEDDRIEAFKKWDPSKTDPSKFKDTDFSSTETILKTSNRKPVNGYYFMTLYDIVDYKMKLNRKKEEAVTELLIQYIGANGEEEKQTIKQKILNLFAGDVTSANSFLAPSLARQIK
jgi:hypothetical protein